MVAGIDAVVFVCMPVDPESIKPGLTKALRSVSDSRIKSDEMQRQVSLGNPTVSLEETMVAMQKSQIGFQATLQVRNRLVQAYSDIMNMAV